MNKFIEVTKAIADKSRIRILFMLNGHELCVCQIVEVLGLAPSTVSKHLSILRHAGLIEGRKEGRWIYYRVSNRRSDIEAQKALAWVHESLARDRQTQKDLRRLKAILKIGKEMLCSQVIQK